jgi:hypothetical protein
MQIGSDTTINNPYSVLGIKDSDAASFKEKTKSGEVTGKSISETYLFQYSQNVQTASTDNFSAQNATFDFSKIGKLLKSIDTNAIGYTGKPLTDMTPDEASAIVGKDGFFGVDKTSTRLSDFVLNGGGDNLDTLKAGRAGIVQGFNEAEKMWGNKLPDISYQTLNKALASIDEKITSLGGSVLNTTA